MIEKLYPTKIDAKWSKMKTKLKAQFKVVSELECGAHAALAIGETDFWSYTENSKQCFLGELTNTKAPGTANGPKEVRVLRSKEFKHLLYNIKNICFVQLIHGII